MTADFDSCSSYDFVSATDITVGTTHTILVAGVDADADIDIDADADVDVDVDVDVDANTFHVYYFGFIRHLEDSI